MSYLSDGVTAARGFLASGISSGIKKSGKRDLALIFSVVPAKVAACFTQNKIKAAPVIVSSARVRHGIAQAIIVNSGCANCCTGERGISDAKLMAKLAAASLGIPERYVLVASTGYIGKFLPLAKIKAGISKLKDSLSRQGGLCALRAIMTTDTRPKIAGTRVKIGAKQVSIGGIAKGAGMIQPDLATMLAFITTDCNINAALLRKALKKAVDISFNTITVDGQTSTNDSIFILANGLAGNAKISKRGVDFDKFCKALDSVTKSLAEQIVRDGEGATKFFTVAVKGAKSDGQAKQAALAIANSPLVKTCIYGGEPNWGRVASSVGISGADFDPKKIEIFLNGKKVFGGGRPARKTLHNLGKEVEIAVDLKKGKGTARILSCDMTEEYIKINAAYE